MAALEKLDAFNENLSTLLERLGFLAVMVLILLTTADVLGTKLFLTPVFGSLDVVMLAQLLSATLASAATLLVGRHVNVTFFLPLLPKALRIAIEILVDLVCLGLFVLLVWRLGLYAHSFQIDSEVSASARIPLYPFAYGAAFGFVPLCLIYVSRILHTITGTSKE